LEIYLNFSDFKDLVARDLQCIIEICISYLARQELDLKIYKVTIKKNLFVMLETK